MNTSEETGKIAVALAKAQGKFTNPEKNRKVTVKTKPKEGSNFWGEYTFTYATLSAIFDAVRPALSDNEISLVQDVSTVQGAVIVTTRLTHASGQFFESQISAKAEGAEIQKLGSTITYLKRYAVTALLGIAAEEDDDGNASDDNRIVDTPPQQQKKRSTSTKKEEDPPPQQKEGEPTPVAWGAFVVDFTEQVRNTATLEALQALWGDNRATLDRLKQEKPQLYESAVKVKDARKIDLQKPPALDGDFPFPQPLDLPEGADGQPDESVLG